MRFSGYKSVATNNGLTCVLTLFLLSVSLLSMAQNYRISGKVTDRKTGKPVSDAQVFLQPSSHKTQTGNDGKFIFNTVKKGNYTIVVFALEMQLAQKEVNLESKDLELLLILDSLSKDLDGFTVVGEREKSFGIDRLKGVEGTSIYEAKKTEVIVMKDITANLATNNARQIFAKVAGLNVWESDGGGLQLGIGARGLNPNRSSEFNTRQNGYDISADALGYPEAYYTPPSEALEKIEVVRGAASLQYGTQFGGMVNFVLKKGPADKPLEITARQTAGSFGLFNSFNSIGGTKGKFNYYAFYQHKRGDGWRENSGFNVNTAYASAGYKVTKNLDVTLDYTFMHYLSRQPGGLTDNQFLINPRISLRSRNWFELNWNLANISVDYRFGNNTKINSRTFGLMASRGAVGFLGIINRVDDGKERDFMLDNYLNWGNETRFIHSYKLGTENSTFLVGSRFYQGFTQRKQGNASAGSTPDFKFLNPHSLEHSDFEFPGQNLAFFAENIFRVRPNFSVTPGARWEHIKTTSEGYYRNLLGFLNDSAVYEKVADKKESSRSFPLFGLGLSYKTTKNMEFYSNMSQNYRAINFNDLRVFNPNIRVDEFMKDESGFNADLGFRGELKKLFNYDVSLFFLKYNDRIGSVLKSDSAGNIYRYRTNIADARSMGLETFAEMDLVRIFRKKNPKFSFSCFSNITLLDARYINGGIKFKDKKMEMAAPLLVKTGMTFRKKGFTTTLQYSYTQKHFSDASNAEKSPTAIEGSIPSYYILDLNGSYNHKRYEFAAGVNNLTNNMYFTRRAITYPGPGIIPADGRSVYLTVKLTF